MTVYQRIPARLVEAVLKARSRYGIRTMCALSGDRLGPRRHPRMDSVLFYLSMKG